MWPVCTCVRTYAQNSKPIWKALYVEWSLEKDPSRNVNFKLWNYPLLNVLFISNQTLSKYIQGWAEVSDRFSNRCGLKLVHATPIKFQTLDYQKVLCLFWKFEAFILKQNWFMIKNRIYFLFQKIEFSTLNFFKENQMFFNKKLLNFIQTEIFCVKLSFLNGQQIW